MLYELPVKTEGGIKRLKRYIETRYVTSINVWGTSVYINLIGENEIELRYDSEAEAKQQHAKIISDINNKNYYVSKEIKIKT